jgi:hypothetical protein
LNRLSAARRVPVGEGPRPDEPSPSFMNRARHQAHAPLDARAWKRDRVRSNPCGITLNRAWTEWAAEHGVSETIAAALYLVSRNGKVGEVVVKLTPDEMEQMERVIAFVQRWPDHFPPVALVALKNSRPTSSLEPSTACGSPMRHSRAAMCARPARTGLRGSAQRSRNELLRPDSRHIAASHNRMTRERGPAHRGQHRQATGAKCSARHLNNAAYELKARGRRRRVLT